MFHKWEHHRSTIYRKMIPVGTLHYINGTLYGIYVVLIINPLLSIITPLTMVISYLHQIHID